MQFENDPFNGETTETVNRLSYKIAEAQQKSVENNQQIIEGQRATSIAMQGDS